MQNRSARNQVSVLAQVSHGGYNSCCWSQCPYIPSFCRTLLLHKTHLCCLWMRPQTPAWLRSCKADSMQAAKHGLCQSIIQQANWQALQVPLLLWPLLLCPLPQQPGSMRQTDIRKMLCLCQASHADIAQNNNSNRLQSDYNFHVR